jgi:hypothetical protein
LSVSISTPSMSQNPSWSAVYTHLPVGINRPFPVSR